MTAALSLALDLAQNAMSFLSVKPMRAFIGQDGTQIIANATIEEAHDDELEMTDQPVEQGATIADHAYMLPSQLVVTAGWSNSPNASGPLDALLGYGATVSPAINALMGVLGAVDGVLNLMNGDQQIVQQAYASLLSAQRARTLLEVMTGKRTYQNMLIKSLTTTTNKQFENAMLIRITFRQLLMAMTSIVTVPNSANMANPQTNGAVQDMGTTSPVANPPNLNMTTLPSINQ